MVEVPEPRVMDEPGARVWLAMMYWDCAFGVIVRPLMMIGAGTLAGDGTKFKSEVEGGEGAGGLETTGSR